MSWTDPETIAIRDESWPEDHAVHVKEIPQAGDRKLMQKHTFRAKVAKQGATQTGDDDSEYLYYQAGLAACAAMVSHVEGDLFKDRTGQILTFEGSFEQRMATAERLPTAVLDFVVAELDRRSEADPLGLKKAETPSKPASKRR
jgi:hypothetical protein